MDNTITPRLADPAIIATAGLEPDQTVYMYPLKQSGYQDSFELFASFGEGRVGLLVKTGFGRYAKAKFRGEHASLIAINNALRGFAPHSFGHGRMAGDEDEFFIITELLNVVLDGPPATLGRRLSRMHSRPAPIHPVFEKPAYGFSVTTFCGEIPQDNTWKASWPQFYVENRLRPICRRIQGPRKRDSELEQQLERVINDVVPELFGRMHPKSLAPSLLHGNLLYSRRSRGQFFSFDNDAEEEVVLGPACFYGHREYELGAARVYGFPPAFFEEYHNHSPRNDPKEDWHWRVLLYELYHRLVVYAR